MYVKSANMSMHMPVVMLVQTAVTVSAHVSWLRSKTKDHQIRMSKWSNICLIQCQKLQLGWSCGSIRTRRTPIFDTHTHPGKKHVQQWVISSTYASDSRSGKLPKASMVLLGSFEKRSDKPIYPRCSVFSRSFMSQLSHRYISMLVPKKFKWRFPKIGVPPNHPFQ